ncbi:hypothetical protein [Streptomyces pini]|uniref:Uncharacterized protein n=1 Tax=Streptomyces pini TaxID=1520580 RepID=A0A1I4C240_9ACTN|nr:hypothetical protein [Streptomyces pini]SFK75134.1 hypothetical protein SAMN05192584_108227 [Streptomyces pini]
MSRTVTPGIERAARVIARAFVHGITRPTENTDPALDAAFALNDAGLLADPTVLRGPSAAVSAKGAITHV